MKKIPNKKVDLMLSDLENRLAGVFTRFFKDRKPALEQAAKELAHDPELVELSVATNALLFQLASLIVLLHRKTGSNLESIVDVETKLLKTLVPVCKGVRDSIDEPRRAVAHAH